MHKDIKEILYTEEEIKAKCDELAKQIDQDYAGQEILLVGLLKGSVPFMAELAKHLKSDVKFDFMSVSSYSGVESKTLVVRQDIKEDIRGKNVLIVEDILDTGKTLYNVKEMLEKRHAKSVKIVTLLDKEEGSVFDMKADYSGFKIPNAFVVVPLSIWAPSLTSVLITTPSATESDSSYTTSVRIPSPVSVFLASSTFMPFTSGMATFSASSLVSSVVMIGPEGLLPSFFFPPKIFTASTISIIQITTPATIARTVVTRSILGS